MKLRFGLQARFLALVGATFVVLACLLLLLLRKEHQQQDEVEAQSLEAMHDMAMQTLRLRGEASTAQLADQLANPLYYFDLEEIGAILHVVRKQPDVGYVQVFDAQGRIVHDGSPDIGSYGRTMDDALAPAAIATDTVNAQWTSHVLDVSAPIGVGDHRLGGVRVGYSLDGMRKYEADTRRRLRERLRELDARHVQWVLLMLLALAAASLLIAWLLQRSLVRPIRRLARAAGEIEAGNFEATGPESVRGDEVGELIRAFTRMRESIVRHDRDVWRMAYTDNLTGLTNRRGFRESLGERLEALYGSGKQLALIFADIDDFKRVNDTMGHEAGDEVIRQYARRVSNAVGRLGGDDALVARFGGDEFVILVQGDDVRLRAQRLADALIEDFRSPISLHGHGAFLGTSVGISLFPEDAVDATELMKCGDIAMYQAKQAGKNCYRLYSRQMNEEASQRIRLEDELRGAWGRGELKVMYQPIWRVEDRTVVGAEALLRWYHPKHGAIPPSQFIAVAERSDLIGEIGLHVLRDACAEAMRWRGRAGQPAPFVAVNVSSRQLRDRDLPEQVGACLRESGLPASRLHVELTETALLRDEALAAGLLTRLHETGVNIWLDDFGTGFSGLSHLRRVPVDGLKIDRSFIADVETDGDDLALTTAIIAMAHSLGIRTVAEGVETEGQFALLRERGCDLAQGYWLGYPMPADEFVKLLG